MGQDDIERLAGGDSPRRSWLLRLLPLLDVQAVRGGELPALEWGVRAQPRQNCLTTARLTTHV